MQKMGYVIGTGLGKRSDGIIDPVTATVLPPGKSLGISLPHILFPINTNYLQIIA